MFIVSQETKKKNDFFYDEDIPLSKRRKESPRSSQPSSPATRYAICSTLIQETLVSFGLQCF